MLKEKKYCRRKPGKNNISSSKTQSARKTALKLLEYCGF